jgi:hypothetical protein
MDKFYRNRGIINLCQTGQLTQEQIAFGFQELVAAVPIELGGSFIDIQDVGSARVNNKQGI